MSDPPQDSTKRDYVTDVPYLRTFSNDLSPGALRFAAAINGFSPPPVEDFDYLELGSGNGDTLITLAAAYPKARFIGVDINAKHVAFARELANRADLGNVRFMEGDFEAIAQHELPGFDYVTMYGVLSWISESKRRAAIKLAGDKLKSGGILFASYNALPGWSAVEPLRRLMLDAAGPTENNVERAHRGLYIAKLLDDAGAHYFTHNPAAKSMLATALSMGIPYAVHEYFLPDWHPMYFEDVAAEMAAANIHFVGQLPLFRNYRDLVIPPTLTELFNGVTDRIAFERLKDYAINEFFRRDVFMKSPAPRGDDILRGYLDSTLFCTAVTAPQVRRVVKLPHYSLQYAGAIFDDLIPALDREPHSVSQLADNPRIAPYGLEQIRTAVLHLALGEQLVPIYQPTKTVASVPSDTFRTVLEHNRFILSQPITTGGLVVLACPTTGSGVLLSSLEVVCMRALAVDPDQRGAWMKAFVAKQPVSLQVQGKSIDSFEDQLSVLIAELGSFITHRLPKLLQLGVLEPTPR